MGKKSSIYLSAETCERLRVPPRGPSAAVAATIERYDTLLAPEKKRLASLLSEAEWNACRNACNGTAWSAAAIRGGVLADIQDSLDEELEAFGADRAALEGKLASLSVVQQYALVEMIEEYWEAQGPADEDPESD